MAFQRFRPLPFASALPEFSVVMVYLRTLLSPPPPPKKNWSQVVEALVKCHKDNPIAKFWGACNEQKWALDRCFREEKVINRKKNLEKARREQAILRQRLAERHGDR